MESTTQRVYTAVSMRSPRSITPPGRRRALGMHLCSCGMITAAVDDQGISPGGATPPKERLNDDLRPAALGRGGRQTTGAPR